MSGQFKPGDRALAIQANSSDLTHGALYYVVAVERGRFGSQFVRLLGEKHPWRADRFLRVRPVERLYPDKRFWEGRE